jgi:hypothetical protein
MFAVDEQRAIVGEKSEALQAALRAGVLKRMPLTFLPFVNQQLTQWEFLFPNERGSVERLLIYVAAMSEEESRALFRAVVDLEGKMGGARVAVF